MPKRDVELSANNATIPAHMSAPPEKTHKSQTTPFTCLPNIIPTHRDTPNRSIRHANAPPHTITQSMHHARQQLTRGQTIFASHQCYPRAAAGSKQKRRAAKLQKSATNGRKSTERSHPNEFSPNALSLPHSKKSCKRLKTNAPSNKFFVQHQNKPQCIMLSSESVDDAWMRMGTHRFLQTTPHTRDASCALRHASLTITRDAHALSVREKSSRNEGYVRLTAGHTPKNHIADIITSSTSSDVGRRVTWIN
ncbi:hypothetical protein MOQ_006757 [Trypanosoma cruzi marinkellei]|uniref:Uncharacterized protein n=1 Tax=Trypanosoma cruzi marinkellei TaxID=85056 RepID=K2MUR0_TRYCR|nr:hypothetical protein MOQ_006757 [Trypanosoma cruzi marinkellei]